VRIFTNGKQVVLRTAKGRVTWTQKAKPTLASEDCAGVSSKKRDGIFAITPSGVDHTAAMLEVGAIDAVGLGENKVAALLKRDRTAVFVIGDPQGDWDVSIPLDEIEAEQVKLPACAVEGLDNAEGIGLPPTEGLEPTLGASEHGFAIASNVTGIVAVVRPDASAVSFTVRVPSQDDVAIHAQPTKRGVLVNLCVNNKAATTVHIAEDGAVINTHDAFGSMPALLLGKQVLVTDEESSELRLLDLDLNRKAKKKLTFWPKEVNGSADGKHFALANDANIALGKVTAAGRLTVTGTLNYAEELKNQKGKGASRRTTFYDPKRAHGSPAIGFPAKQKPPPWELKAGEAFALELLVRSAGGKGKGLFVLLEGDALARIEVTHITCADQRADFADVDGSRRAELPDADLVEGIRYPLDPSPKNDKQKEKAATLLAACHFNVTVHGSAKKASRDLLRVSCGALDSQASPMKWMRPLIIS
jgi:hypothetical protein